ncbi:hypothetical protein BWI93_26960 [Siphonobacter sp. BAB-5385]|uniref:hypothetical protein n=1 Tax=Siphonobacter sp. BAB-5385 TaxID=1864822 RepID=UPI000B9DD26A|nr:hypothetical protein [Siphonobacter sp. BAB-5385]OZI05188.1 hypothetical protein BWI93_26960 [Siphonobacter sp. BAB-5385]
METLLRSIEINYQTAELIPAPYSHKYFIRCTVNRADELHVVFRIEYTDRDDLTEEEILGEGFTGNDDFEWEGTLLPVWTEELRSLVAKTDFYKTSRPAQEAENQFWLNIEYKDQEPLLGKPRNREPWEYLSQELIQAIYETARLEAPLKLIYLKKLKDKSVQLEMNVFFSKRTVKMNMQVDNIEKSNELRWDTLNPVLRLIYAGEFLAEKATPKKPDHPGNFINVGDGLWYEFGKSLVNPSGNNRFLNDIERTLDELSQLPTE